VKKTNPQRPLTGLRAISSDQIRRWRAQKSLIHFILHTFPDYQAGWFHRDICRRLEKFFSDVLAKQSPRLTIFAPPRHGKSQIVSRHLPAWMFGRDPDLAIIAASYSADLASRMNRDVQRIMESDEYREVFPDTKLWGRGAYSDSNTLYLRNTEVFEIIGHRGIYRSAGIGVGITGMGADVLIIDDPIKDVAEAMSPTVRNTLFDWFTSTAYPRLSPGGGIFLIQTRWHEDDLAGRLLEKVKAGGDEWEVVSYPAIAEEDEFNRKAGEALHPERYSLKRLEKIQAAIGSRFWAALYQQRPAPQSGGLFQRQWFEMVNAVPANSFAVRYWDRAGTKETGKNDPDWTVDLRLARDEQGLFYVTDVVRFRGTPHEVRTAIKNTASGDGAEVHIGVEQEPGSSGQESADTIIKELAGFCVKADRVTGSKVLRAEPVSAQAEAGNIKLVRGDWNEAFLSEIETFPFGKHDDQVDALSGAFAMLAWRGGEIVCISADRDPVFPDLWGWRKVNGRGIFDFPWGGFSGLGRFRNSQEYRTTRLRPTALKSRRIFDYV